MFSVAFSPSASSRSRVRFSLLFVVLTGLLMPAMARAQVSFNGAQRTLASGFDYPGGVTVDPNGNVYVGDSGHQRVKEILANGGSIPGTPTINTLGSGFSGPIGVAVDASGNVFVADFGNSEVKEILAVNGSIPASPTINVLGSGFSYPTGVAVDASGNVYVADFENSEVKEILAVNGSIPASPTINVLGSGFRGPEGVAVDASGNVYVADSSNNAVKEILAVSGSIPATNPIINVLGSGFSGPNGVAVDENGNVYVADTSNSVVKEILAVGGSIPATNPTILTLGSGFAYPGNVQADGHGNVFVADTNHGNVDELQLQSVDFGQLAIGSLSAAQTLSFSIASGTTVGSIAVMTAGSPNLDFTNAGGSGSCASLTYSSAETCVVNVTFKPQFAGTRLGAVVFFSGANNTGTILANVPIYGVGTGPQIAFNQTPINRFTANINGYQLEYPGGVAVDGAGDLFVTDNNPYFDGLVEFPAGGGAATIIPLTANSSPQGMAIDGAGDLFIADYNLNQVVELPVGGGTPVVISPTVNGIPMGHLVDVAVDGSGDLYIADPNNNRVVEVPANGSPAFEFNPIIDGNPGLGYPAQIAVDEAGDLFIVDTTEQRVVEVPAGNGAPFVVNISVNGYPGLSEPGGIAVDPAGDLFISNIARVVEVPQGGGAAVILQTIGDGSANFGRMTLDGAGDLFVANPNSDWVEEFHRSEIPNLNFPTLTVVNTTDTADGTTTVAVQNIGNQPLDFTALNYPLDFSATSDPNACSSSTTLNSMQECDLPIEFTPQNDGLPLSEYVTLTDNALNVTGAIQAIPVSGSASAPVTVTVSISPTGSQYVGQVFVVDNTQYTSAQTFTWAVGSTHTLQTVGNFYTTDLQTLYTLSSWNPGTNSDDQTVTATAGVNNYTANYVIYAYLLTDSVNNSAEGSVTPASGGAYNAGAPTPITATANAGYYFTGWTGSADIASASSASTTITMNHPETITANFAPLPILVVTTANDDVATATNCTPQAVAGTGTDAACSLRDALAYVQNNAAPSSTISFDSTVFAAPTTITLNAGSFMYLEPNSTIIGPTTGSGATLTNLVTVSGNNAHTVFRVPSHVSASLVNLNITGGLNPAGGAAILNQGTLTVTGCNITGNASTATTSNASIQGGAIENLSTLILTNSTVSGNSANLTTPSSGSAEGGAIYNGGTLTVTGSALSGNSITGGGDAYGGAIFVSSPGTFTATNTTISGNTVSGNEGWGGGIASDSTVNLTNVTLSGNQATSTASASSGGGIYATGNAITSLTNATISGNQAMGPSGAGGGIYATNATTTNVANSIVSGNLPSAVPDIYTDGPLNFTGVNQIFVSGINLAPLANYGGPTQTMLPLPGSPAICSAPSSISTGAGLTGDQRGLPFNPACASGFVDVGAVQTNYALAFTAEPPSTTVISVALSPVPVVTLTESGALATAASSSVSATGSPIALSGNTSASFASGSASFSNLQVPTATPTETLTATLALSSTLNLTANSSSFAVTDPLPGAFQLTTTATPINNNVSIAITVTALLAGGGTDVYYNGTVSFTSSDPGFVNPGPLTLTNGVGQTNVSFETLGTQTITAADTVTATEMGTGSFSVTPAPTAGFHITVPGSANVGAPFPFAISAYDIHGNPAIGYAGTLSFTSTDPGAMLPSPTTLINGTGTFQATLATPGTQTITATDSANSLAITSSNIAVTVANLVVNTTTDDAGTAANCTPQPTATSNPTDAACSLRDALVLASNLGAANIGFDSTVFAASNGAAANTINISTNPLNVPSNTSITGPTTGSGATLAQIVTVNANQTALVFNVNSGVTNASISGLSIANGNDFGSNNGGDIYNGGTLTVANSLITGGLSVYGAGIYNSGTIAILGSTISGNTAYSGAGIGNQGTLTATNTTISGNTTGIEGSDGGGITSVSGVVTLVNSTVSGNFAGSYAGAISTFSTQLTLTNSTVYGNTADADIGGISIDGGNLILANSTIANNSIEGLSLYSTVVNMSNSVISGNGNDVFNENNTATMNDNGGNVIGGVTFSPLGNYGGPMQTAIPLPGNAAICGGTLANATAASVTVDQRGYPFDPLCPTGFVDSGALQTSFALAFATQPPSGIGTQPISPAPTVQLTESGLAAPGAFSPAVMTDSAGLVDGTTSVNFAPGLATFSNLDFSAGTASDTLTATLPLNSTQKLTAVSTSFSVASPVVNHFLVTTTANPIYSNAPFTITIAAVYPGGTTATGYNGTVSFTSSDSGFVNPGPLTLSGGIGQAIVTLATQGMQTITATDTTTSALTGTGSFSVVLPTAGLHIAVPAAANVGTPFNFTVTAYDTLGNTSTGYTGTVAFTSTDSNAVLPSPTMLTNGIGTFSATLISAGTQTITATDVANSFTITSSGITVTPPILVVNTAADDSGNPAYCTTQAAPGSNTTDSACSLRDALAASTNLAAANISFDSNAFAASNGTAANTILLAYGELLFPPNTSVTGPTTGSGATLAPTVTVSGNALGTVFFINTGITNATINGLSITNGSNPGYFGGDIYNAGGLTITNSSITSGMAEYGGGIENQGTLVLTGVTISGNSAFQGGGIDNEGILTATASTISDNTTGASGSSGGGISSYSGSTTLINSTVSGNYSNSDGGGIAVYSPLTLINSTVYGNSTGAGVAGAFTASTTLTMVNSTIADNSGVGLFVYNSQVSMSNNILSGNGYDLFNQGSTITDNGGDVTGGVTFTALGNYGGSTQTVIPVPGNAAICGGTLTNATTANVTADQRGLPFDSLCSSGFVDSGAVQTHYALAFTTEPPSSITSGLAMSPAPVVGLTESGVVAVASGPSVLMTDSSGLLAGTTSVSLASGSATFSGLVVPSVASNDYLTATLPLNSSLNLTAQSSQFQVLAPPTPHLTSPAPGTVLGTSNVTLSWTSVTGVTAYDLYLGTTGVGSANLYNSTGVTTTSVTVSTLPSLGATVYARLWYKVGGVWQFNDYTYTESPSVPPVLTSPTPGTVLGTNNVVFSWTPGAGVTGYDLYIGNTGVGSSNLYNSAGVTTTSITVLALPSLGATVYVRLSYKINGTWQNSDYTYTESPSAAAVLTSPTPGSVLGATNVVFFWTPGAGVTAYDLYIGTTGAGSANLYNSTAITTTSFTAPTLPSIGAAVYVRLSYKINGTWQNSDYTYTESPSVAPVLTSPTPGSVIGTSNVVFSWTPGAGVTAYDLYIGNTGVGSSNLYNSAGVTTTSVPVPALPSLGATLYVRLSYRINGTWQNSDYTYTESPSAAPVLTSPAPGSVVGASNVTFSWTPGAGVTAYDLYLGTTGVGSANLYNSTGVTTTSVTVPTLPSLGATVYARLSYRINGAWQNSDYTYTEPPSAAPVLSSPTPGSVLGASNGVFSWTSGAGVTAYDLYLGTTGVGSANLYNSGAVTTTSFTAPTLPSIGATIYARLSYRINGAWQSTDYTYTESPSAAPVLTSPTPGSVLGTTNVVFSWTPGAGVTVYDLYLGTTGAGSVNLYNSASVTTTSVTVPTVPSKGATVYARLYYQIKGVWQFSDYTYTEQ